jgi:hypothetical protein
VHYYCNASIYMGNARVGFIHTSDVMGRTRGVSAETTRSYRRAWRTVCSEAPPTRSSELGSGGANKSLEANGCEPMESTCRMLTMRRWARIGTRISPILSGGCRVSRGRDHGILTHCIVYVNVRIRHTTPRLGFKYIR